MHILIIGTGSIGQRHLRNALRIEEVRCSVAEMNAATREKVASEHPVQAVYADYREANLASFDGVVIAVPAHLHIPIAIDVVAAGTHVLSEKPLSTSPDRVNELIRLRDEKGVVVSVAFTLRSNPIMQDIKRRLADRELGAPLLVNAYYGQYWPRMRIDYPPAYAQSRETGGGVIPDHLVHYLNCFEWFFGPTAQVSATQWRRALDDIATEDVGLVTLRYASDVTAHIGSCLFQQDTTAGLQIICEAGTYQLKDDCNTLNVYRGSTQKWMRETAGASERDDVFVAQMQHFIDCTQGRATPLCSIEEAAQTLCTVLTALESSDGDSRFLSVAQDPLV
ncbi:MAG: Gfo/Idh/MocA family oxidoreductase [Phycisphaeraceae bacterium]|jgi:predicted dehydrogenase|nr:Gfo/Idh/MocA family oxidoreductase [Phycisphaeraceae bacterium]MDP7346719.1 Gfo/Idh/MocA family oxidoreductase [Phycisphaeraceae bacterium]